MEPYVASSDAAVVERVIQAGGRIVGKLNLDNFSSGGSGETSWFGPARNPFDQRHSAGGSSGGAGAALASGSVDLALGVDQAGSARIPASYCGLVALKATHGTVPTYGVTHLDHTLDAICPMAYTTDAETFRQQVAAVRQASGGRQLYAGVGAYRLSSEQIIRHVGLARDGGADGFILFSYDSLVSPERGPDSLAAIGRAMSAR
jgi:amidase